MFIPYTYIFLMLIAKTTTLILFMCRQHSKQIPLLCKRRRTHKVAIVTFWRTFRHDGKTSPTVFVICAVNQLYAYSIFIFMLQKTMKELVDNLPFL
jgi:hypothetical protein